MRLALQQAQAAFDAGEVPVGAVLVIDSQVVAASANATEARRNPLCHAELLCISAAAEQQLAWRLQDATLYSTLEPCPMCAGAVLQARLARLVYGARQPRVGADGSWVALFPAQPAGQQQQQQQQDRGSAAAVQPTGPHPFHPSITVTRGVLQEECGALMRAFFRQQRQRQQQQGSADNQPPQPGERTTSRPDAGALLFDAAAGQQPQQQCREQPEAAVPGS
jgi:tRNA(adenine34) deaminase